MVKRFIGQFGVLDALGVVGIVMLGAGLWLYAPAAALIVVGGILTATYLWPAFLAALRSGRGTRE